MDIEMREIWELLHAGDWACAHGDAEALGRVAVGLVSLLEVDLARLAVAVAGACPRDLAEATRRWSILAEDLRSRTEAVSTTPHLSGP
jgi:hypothetical protein